MANEIRVAYRVETSEAVGNLDKLDRKLKLVAKSEEQAEKSMAGSSKQIKANADQLEKLRAKLNPGLTAQQKFTRQTEQLTAAFKRGAISGAEYNLMLANANRQLDRTGGGFSKFGRNLMGLAGITISAATAMNVLKSAMREAMEAERESALMGQALKSLGTQTDITRDHVEQLAQSMSRAFAFDDEAVLQAERTLIRFGVTTKAQLGDALQVSVDVSRMLGVELVQASEMVGKALQEPGEGMKALKVAGLNLSDAVLETAKSMAEFGDKAGAQQLVLSALRAETDGAAVALGETMPIAMDRLTASWNNLLQALGTRAGGGSGPLSMLASMLDKATDGVTRHFGAVDELVNKYGELGRVLSFLAQMPMFGAGASFLLSKGAGSRKPVEKPRPLAPTGDVIIDPAAMEAASKRVIKALDDEGKAAEKASKGFASAVKSLGALRIETLATVDPSERLFKAFGAEGFAGPDASAYREVQQIIAETVSDGEKLAHIQELLNYAVEKEWISADKAAQAFREQAEALGFVSQKTEEVANQWDEINRGFNEAIGQGLHDAAAGFFKEMGKGLVDDLPKWLQPFGNALLNASAEWFADIMAKIVKAAIAARAIKAGEGGGGGGGTSWWQSFMSGMKGSGSSGTSGGSNAALGVGIVVAAAAFFKMLNDRKRKGSYNTQATYDPYGGDTGAFSMSGNHQTAQAALEGLRGFYAELAGILRAGSDSMQSVMVKVRGDKKAFRAYVDGELIGTFKTLEEATVAGVRQVMLNGVKNIDEATRHVLQNYQTNDPAKLLEAVTKVQALVDLSNGIDEVGSSILSILPSIRQLTIELENYGLQAAEVARLSGVFALDQFRKQWDQLAGNQVSPAEQRKIAERNRAILISQLKLYKLELQGKLNALKVEASIVQWQAKLHAAEILGETGFLRRQAKLLGIDLQLRQEYLDAQGILNEEQAKIYNDLIKQTQDLIDEVSGGTIKLGRGGRGRGGGGGSSYQDRLLTAIERLISAVTVLREFQEELKQDEALSPYSTQQRFFMARSSFNTIAQQAMSGNVGAMEQLPAAARLYLELAQQMFGRAGAGYGGIFEQVQALLQAISDQYPQGQDPQAWLRSDMEAVNRYLESLHLDGRRRREQHDETNRRLREISDLLESGNEQNMTNGNAMTRLVSMQRAAPVRNGSIRAA